MRAVSLALALSASAALDAWAQPPDEPYSCRLLNGEQRKCALNPKCDQRVIDRLKRECLRDGGRP